MSTVGPGGPHTSGLEFLGSAGFPQEGVETGSIQSRGTGEEERCKKEGHRAPLGGRSCDLRGAGPHQPEEPVCP